MTYKIILDTPATLVEYRKIPIAFWVTSKLRVVAVDKGLAGLQLIKEPVSPPYLKNYDAHDSVLDWSKRWDISNWAIFLAVSNSLYIGGAAVAWKSPGVSMLEERDDLAVLWDIRVAASHRGQGIGTALFHYAVQWATSKGCTRLKSETQNINVPACRFYANQGCILSAIDMHAYPDLPHEVQLIWSKPLFEL